MESGSMGFEQFPSRGLTFHFYAGKDARAPQAPAKHRDVEYYHHE
jgi:hypothetical protein